MLGFAQAMLPEGWINWMGVVPDARRRGIGRLLIADIARQVRRRPRHPPGGPVEVDTPGQAFLAALGLPGAGRRGARSMIRRAG